MLRRVRQTVAITIFACITFYFLDFSGIISQDFHYLERIQFVPAVLGSGFIVLVGIILCNLLLGRIYCSAICPLGLFQDVIGRISKLFNKKKQFRYLAENKILRWTILLLFATCFVFNVAFLLSLLEPYSQYGRILTNLFRPVYWYLNNLLALIFNSFGNYSFYLVDVYIVSLSSLIMAAVSLLIVIALSFRSGRLYCNAICPVGTVLGYLSTFSLYKVRINNDKCNSCGLCATKCKASCIDSKSHRIDYSRCVDCYNCLSVCRSNAISFTYKKSVKTASPVATDQKEARRRFLTITTLSLLASAKSKAQEIHSTLTGKTITNREPIVPPGGKSVDHLTKHCTACHLCISKCPSKVIKPAFTEYGFTGMMLPIMTYQKGFCNFDCTVCSEICPTKALEKLEKEEKHLLKTGQVNYTLEHCIVYLENTSCGACSEYCPTQAVSMKDYKDGLTIPSIRQEICVGCGGCEYICPAAPKAIYVVGLPIHEKAKAVEKKE